MAVRNVGQESKRPRIGTFATKERLSSGDNKGVVPVVRMSVWFGGVLNGSEVGKELIKSMGIPTDTQTFEGKEVLVSSS